MNNDRKPSDRNGQPPPRHGWARINDLGPQWIGAIAALIAALGGIGGFFVGRAFTQTVTVTQTGAPAVTQTVTATVTKTVAASPVNTAGYIYFGGHIVEWANGRGQPNTSWLVGSNGERYWIPTTSIFFCLEKHGHTDLGLQPSAVLNDLPINGQWASCR
jgi:hypothetical protein